MDIEDLEYHITFPAPTPKSADENAQYRDYSVVLLGWMNSSDKNLSKYSNVYERNGFTTLRYNTTSGDMVTKQSKEVAKKLVDVLVEMSLADNPVLFHVFSNGGCRLFLEICAEIERLNKAESDPGHEIRMLGVIYDSAPGKRRVSSALGAYFAGRPNNLITIIQKAFFAVTLVSGSLVQMCLDTVRSIFGLSQCINSLHEAIKTLPITVPELYLYSHADQLILWSDVKEVIEHRRTSTRYVASHMWSDSPHVQHLRSNPEEYSGKCLEFVQYCFKKEE